uniref:Uncharacterized protein n=1 Tax=Solanum lycopersicum TaxID=4081 RepID=A0A3Q7HIZ6_SOLLC
MVYLRNEADLLLIRESETFLDYALAANSGFRVSGFWAR